MVSPEVKDIKISRFVNTFDLVPTLFDILGVTFNPRFYLGNNAFCSESESSIVVSHRIIFNDKFAYDGMVPLFVQPGASARDRETFINAWLSRRTRQSHIEHLFVGENNIFF
jgi:hypothetical protein